MDANRSYIKFLEKDATGIFPGKDAAENVEIHRGKNVRKTRQFVARLLDKRDNVRAEIGGANSIVVAPGVIPGVLYILNHMIFSLACPFLMLACVYGSEDL